MKKAYCLEITGIKIEVSFKNIKHLNLSVRPPDGEVRVSAPPRLSRAEIAAFVYSRLAWIREKRSEIISRPREMACTLAENSIHFIWGSPHTLHIHPNCGENRALCEDSSLHIYTKGGATDGLLGAILAAWEKMELGRVVAERLAFWRPHFGLPEIAFGLRQMKSRWGSCHYRKNKIVLNTALVRHSPLCLDYVIVHELTHFFAPNHGEQFYGLLEKHMPDWRQRKELLNSPLR